MVTQALEGDFTQQTCEVWRKQNKDKTKRKNNVQRNTFALPVDRVLLLTNLFSLVFAFLQVAFNLSWILVRSDKSSLDSLPAKLVRNFIQTEKQDQNIWLFYKKA